MIVYPLDLWLLLYFNKILWANLGHINVNTHTHRPCTRDMGQGTRHHTHSTDPPSHQKCIYTHTYIAIRILFNEKGQKLVWYCKHLESTCTGNEQDPLGDHCKITGQAEILKSLFQYLITQRNQGKMKKNNTKYVPIPRGKKYILTVNTQPTHSNGSLG